MATRDGAAAIGRDDLGALEPGRWADLVHVDLADPAFVDPADDAQLLSNLVWAGGARLVRDVWVAGDQVLADGEPTRVDRTAATATSARSPPASTPDPSRESPCSSPRVATFATASRHLRHRESAPLPARVGTTPQRSKSEIDRCDDRLSPRVDQLVRGDAESTAGDRPAARRGGRRRRRASRGRPGLRIRPVGARWSWSPLAVSDDVALDTSALTGIVALDAHRVRVRAGEKLHDLLAELAGHGLSIDVVPRGDGVTIGGAVSTGTHGSAPRSARSPRWSGRFGWSTAMASCTGSTGRTSMRPVSGWARSAS